MLRCIIQVDMNVHYATYVHHGTKGKDLDIKPIHLEDCHLACLYQHEVEPVGCTFYSKTKRCFVHYGPEIEFTNDKIKEPPGAREPLPCLACSSGSTDLKVAIHPTYSCDVWRYLTYNEKLEKVNCIYHPSKGLKGDHTTAECKVGKARCHNCKENNTNGHHTWFCYQLTSKTANDYSH